MTEKLKFSRSGWWRFDQYLIEKGRIRPHPEAILERFDPWQDYEQGRHLQDYQPPYLTLINAIRNIHLDQVDGNVVPVGNSASKVLAWATQFGLLGIFPQQVLMIRHRDRLEDPGCWEEKAVFRVGGSWRRTGRILDDEDAEPMIEPTATYFNFDHGFKGGDEPLNGSLTASCLSDFLVGQDIGFPDPEDADFWNRYCEPFVDWIVAARSIAEAVEGNNAETLNNLLAGVSMEVSFDGPNVLTNYQYASLAAILASMFVQDRQRGVRSFHCSCCGALVNTSTYQARYCSKRCAWKDRKRRARKAEKETIGGKTTRK